MAKNYESVSDALKLAEEESLQRLGDAFQEHLKWLQQAADELRLQVTSHIAKSSTRAKRGRPADKVGHSYISAANAMPQCTKRG